MNKPLPVKLCYVGMVLWTLFCIAASGPVITGNRNFDSGVGMGGFIILLSLMAVYITPMLLLGILAAVLSRK